MIKELIGGFMLWRFLTKDTAKARAPAPGDQAAAGAQDERVLQAAAENGKRENAPINQGNGGRKRKARQARNPQTGEIVIIG